MGTLAVGNREIPIDVVHVSDGGRGLLLSVRLIAPHKLAGSIFPKSTLYPINAVFVPSYFKPKMKRN